MSTVGKVLIACISAIFLVISGASVVLSNTEETNANHYLDSASKVILESNYNQSVIDECCQNAADNGYTLQVTLYGDTKPGTKKYAQMKLTYTYSMNLFQYEKQKSIEKII